MKGHLVGGGGGGGVATFLCNCLSTVSCGSELIPPKKVMKFKAEIKEVLLQSALWQ